MARPKPPRIIVWVVLITLALIGMMGAIIYAERENIANFLNGVNQEEVQEDPQVIIEEPVTTYRIFSTCITQYYLEQELKNILMTLYKLMLYQRL